MRVQRILKQPYPFNSDKPYVEWVVNLSFSVFVILFLLLLQPFQLHEVSSAYKFKIFSGYGGVSFLILSLNTLLSYRLKSIFVESKWVVWKHIVYVIWIFFTIGLGNFFYTYLIFHYPEMSLKGVLIFQVNTILVGIFPITLLVLIKQNYLLRKFSHSAKDINSKMDHEQKEDLEEIELFAENDKDSLIIPIDNLLYIQAYGNYVKVCFKDGDDYIIELLRTSLKRLQPKLLSIKGFFKSHRAYILNSKKIKSVQGNAQGYQLLMDGTDETIPVSRSYIKAFNEFIQ